MSRFVVSTIALIAGFFMIESASAAQPVGIDVLTARDSPLAQGEVIAFFGDSITQGGARPGGYCKLIAVSNLNTELRNFKNLRLVLVHVVSWAGKR